MYLIFMAHVVKHASLIGCDTVATETDLMCKWPVPVCPRIVSMLFVGTVAHNRGVISFAAAGRE